MLPPQDAFCAEEITMRIIKIASVLLLAMFMLFGTGCNTAGSAAGGVASAVPSDGDGQGRSLFPEVIAAIKARWTADENEKFAALKNKLQADLTKLQADMTDLQDVVAKCAKATVEDMKANGNANFCLLYSPGDPKYSVISKLNKDIVAGWYFGSPGGKRFNTQDDCVDEYAQKQCLLVENSKVDDDRSKVDDDRSKIANFKFRVNENEYVITVEKVNNYEGNIISYVDLRTKGTDDIDRYKVTLQRQNNTLSVVSMESSPQ
jgi:hypothetical protein